MFWNIALRNILSHKKRSIITLALTAFSTTLLVFSSAFMDGSHQKMLANAVEVYPGYLQITQRDFRDNPSYDNLITDASAVRQKLARIPGIAAYTPRLESYVLFAADDKTTGGMLTGIDPAGETRISRLQQSLKDGDYLSNEDTAQVYIGLELAKRLRVKVGDELDFIGTAADFSFAADKLYVKGIFQTGLYDFDATAAFINKAYFDEVMASDNYASHFIVLPTEPEHVDKLATIIGQDLGDGYQALSWRQTLSGLVQAMELDSIFGYISMGILFLVIFFVIMIYTLLAIMGRLREIGVLRALGTTPGQICLILGLESLLLASASVTAGGLLGGSLSYYFHVHPIILSGYEEQFKQYGLAASSMPTAFHPLIIGRDMLIVFILSLSSSLYPIIKVNDYTPVEAMRHV